MENQTAEAPGVLGKTTKEVVRVETVPPVPRWYKASQDGSWQYLKTLIKCKYFHIRKDGVFPANIDSPFVSPLGLLINEPKKVPYYWHLYQCKILDKATLVDCRTEEGQNRIRLLASGTHFNAVSLSAEKLNPPDLLYYDSSWNIEFCKWFAKCGVDVVITDWGAVILNTDMVKFREIAQKKWRKILKYLSL